MAVYEEAENPLDVIMVEAEGMALIWKAAIYDEKRAEWKRHRAVFFLIVIGHLFLAVLILPGFFTDLLTLGLGGFCFWHYHRCRQECEEHAASLQKILIQAGDIIWKAAEQTGKKSSANYYLIMLGLPPRFD